jgi:hypothetical protein
MENVVIGFFNVLKMLAADPTNIFKWAGKLFIIPFFCVHYGMFTAVHGVFVFGLFSGSFFRNGPMNASSVMQVLKDSYLFYAAITLVISHGFSFVYNYLGKGEYKTASLDMLMASPYGRVVVLHLTILLGGFLMLGLNSPVLGLLLLVVMKIFMDVKAHMSERRKFGIKELADTAVDA